MSVESTDEPCSEIKLLTLSNGDAVLLWKQSGEDSVALKGVPYYANTGNWGAVFDVANAVKTDADVSLWEKDGIIAVAYLTSIDAENDRLMVADLDLAELTVSAVEVDADGLKGSVVGTQFQNNDLVMWAEIDEYGYYSIAGAVHTGVQWEAMPQIEDRPYDVGHLALSTIGEELHIAWRHKKAYHGYYFMNTVTYSNSNVSDVQTLDDLGGANPILVNGGDGKLYAQWFDVHTEYSEYVPDEGWKSASRPFCTASNLLGTCYNNGSEHTINVSGQYGVSAWIERDIRSVVVSLSQ